MNLNEMQFFDLNRVILHSANPSACVQQFIFQYVFEQWELQWTVSTETNNIKIND